MTKVTKHIKQLSKYRQLTNKYFNLLPLDNFGAKINSLHSTKLSLKQRKENYKNLKPVISQLKEIFKKRVVESNKNAKFLGYPNFLEFILASNIIPKREFNEFFKNIDSFVSLVHKDFPATELVKKVKDWSILSIPAPDGNLALSNKFELPDEVINLISRYDERVTKYKNRIEIKFDEDDFSSGAMYVEDKDIVTITLSKTLIDLDKALILVHELGHALDFLDCEDKKIISFTLPKYLTEYSAIEFTHKFIKKEISKRRQKLIRYNLLHTLASTLFEIDIFTNDKQDFDKAYAKAINRCYPMAQQKKNPLYVFNNRFIFRALGMLIHNIVNVELYLEET